MLKTAVVFLTHLPSPVLDKMIIVTLVIPFTSKHAKRFSLLLLLLFFDLLLFALMPRTLVVQS